MSSPNSPKPKQNQSVIKSAVAMAAGTFSSRILGFARDAVMNALFPRQVTDAFVVAFRLPNMFRRLLGEGSLSVSFIPLYIEARKDSRKNAEDMANAVFTVVFALAVTISVACFVFMDPIVRFLVDNPDGFASVPGKVEQTIYLARIMIFYLVLVTTYAFHMAVANTLGHFFWPSVGPTLFNVGLIIFTIIPDVFGQYPGATQSLGVIVGGVLQMGVVLWLLVKESHLPKLTLKIRSPRVGQVFRNMMPGLFGLGVFQVMTIVNTKFAAGLPEGAQTYIYLADRILELPQSLIAVSLGTALLPRFSEFEAQGDRKSFLHEANLAVRSLLYLSLPAAVGMYILSVPLTEVLFMRGAFTAADARGTAAVVEIYSLLMLFSSLSRVTAPAFYALKNTWLPAVVACGVLVLHIIIGPIMVRQYGLQGLAGATTFSSILNIVVLQIFFFFMIGPLGYGRIIISVLRTLPGLLVLAMICREGYPKLLELAPDTWSGHVNRTLSLAVVVSVGMIAYFAITLLTGSEASRKVLDILKRRVFKKRA
ncbi:MAG: murein biosynthesis integral membrane protein MurJ [Bdellovibrionales bacterium]